MLRTEFIQRTITAFFIAAFTLVPVIFSPWSYLAWLCIIHFLCLREFFTLHGIRRGVVTHILFPAFATAWLVAAGMLQHFGYDSFPAVLLLPLVGSALLIKTEIIYKEPVHIQPVGMLSLAALGYISLPLWSGTLLMRGDYQFQWILVPVVMIWLNDLGGYLVGNWLGKRKIAPAISPGKSLEGTMGGVFLVIAGGIAISKIWSVIPLPYALFLGILTPGFALAGDLWESALKRKAGVKDSGQLLPGHGGMLDRYDSFLFVLPLAVLGYFIFVA